MINIVTAVRGTYRVYTKTIVSGIYSCYYVYIVITINTVNNVTRVIKINIKSM